jgi:hypothetical protein
MMYGQRVAAGGVVWVLAMLTAPARLIFDFFGNFGPIGRVVIHHAHHEVFHEFSGQSWDLAPENGRCSNWVTGIRPKLVKNLSKQSQIM